MTANGAFTLLKHLIAAWRPYAHQHEFTMPDLHHVLLPSTDKIEKQIEINELKHRFTTYVTEIVEEKRKVSLAAHFTHSLDAYLLRSVLRRTSFNTKAVLNANKLMAADLSGVSGSSKLSSRIQSWEYTGMADVSIIHRISSKEDVAALPVELRKELKEISDSMLHYGSFDTLTVHDCFRTHFNNANGLRYAYKETLAQIADSSILDDWFIQVTGQGCQMQTGNSLSEYIRNSNYSIC